MGHLESPRSPYTRTLHSYWSAAPFSRKEAGPIRGVSPSWARRLFYHLNILGMSRTNESILSSYTPSRTSRRIRISANLPLFRWVTRMYSCMSAIMCAFRPLTVDGSPPWSLEHSDLVTSCTACSEVGLNYR